MNPRSVLSRRLLPLVVVVAVLAGGNVAWAGGATAAGSPPGPALPDEPAGPGVPEGPSAPELPPGPGTPPFDDVDGGDPEPTPEPGMPGPEDPAAEPPLAEPGDGGEAPGDPGPGEPVDVVPDGGSAPAAPTTGAAAPVAARTLRNLAYGPGGQQRLDLYLPAGTGPHGLIVFAHGGGWCCGSRAEVPATILDLRSQGWAVASISYRLASPTRTSWPGNLHDFKRATRWLRSEAEVYRLDPGRVVAAGASAGGTLAALAANTATRTLEPNLPVALARQRGDYQGVIGLVAPVSLHRFFRYHHMWGALAGNMVGCGGRCTAAQLRPASPLTHLTAAAPPQYLVFGSHDQVVSVREASDYLARWNQVVPGAGRGRLWIQVANAGHSPTPAQANSTRLRQFLAAVTTGVWPPTRNSLPRPPAPGFRDVPRSAWFAPAAVWAANERIVTGVGGTRRFDPNAVVTRAAFTVMLWRAVGSPPTRGQGGFADVPAGAWFAAAAAWSVNAGVVNAGARFEPGRPITRADAAAMLWRAVGAPPPRRAVSFTDVPRQSWVHIPAAWAVGAGVVGNSNRFQPNQRITRAVATAMVWRTYR